MNRVLFDAITLNDMPKFLKALDQDLIDINSRDTDGDTPLTRAIKCNNRQMAQKLLENGADANKEKFVIDMTWYEAREYKDKTGDKYYGDYCTPLQYITLNCKILNDQLFFIKLLIGSGAIANEWCFNGAYTQLKWNNEIASLLVNAMSVI